MKKLFAIMLCIVMSMGVLVGATSCKKPADLEIKVVNVGYGAQWAHDLAAAYTKKHPEISIEVDDTYSGTLDKEFVNELVSGVTTTDIYFSRDAMFKYSQGGTMANGKYYNPILEDLTELYNTPNPYDNNVKIIDKIHPTVLSDLTVQRTENGQTVDKQYTLPWVADVLGLLYNEQIFDQYNLTIPNTTDELIALCEQIKSINTAPAGETPKYELYPFMDSFAYSYFSVLEGQWLTQYEGVQAVNNIYNGIDPDGLQNTADILSYDGMLETYKVYEELLKFENKYVHPDNKDLNFTQAQHYILNSNKMCAMMPNGAWIQREMEVNYRPEQIHIKFMKTPIISSIIGVLPDKSVADDAELSAVIKAIDNGSTALSGEGYSVTQNDFNRLCEARGVVNSWSFGHIGYIPVYSDKKDLAKDFLYFLASDEGMKIFTKATKGCTSPYTPKSFDYATDPEMNSIMNDFSKGVREIWDSSNIMGYEVGKHPLFSHGGFTVLYTWTETSIITAFSADPNAENTKYMSAEDYFTYRWNYWSNKWQTVLTSAGLAG